MQQLELFPELTTTEPYIGVEFTDGEDVYVSAKGIYFIDDTRSDCQGCNFAYDSTSKRCNIAEETLSCFDNPIIWVKKG